MTDLADDIYEATGMILGTQQAAAMTAFVRARVAAARREGIEAAAEIAKQFAIHQGDAYDIVAAIHTKLLTEGGR